MDQGSRQNLLWHYNSNRISFIISLDAVIAQMIVKDLNFLHDHYFACVNRVLTIKIGAVINRRFTTA